jgi:hypothetical protein
MPLFRAGSGNCGRSANGLGDVHAWLYGPCERFAAAVAAAAGAASAGHQRMARAGPMGASGESRASPPRDGVFASVSLQIMSVSKSPSE